MERKRSESHQWLRSVSNFIKSLTHPRRDRGDNEVGDNLDADLHSLPVGGKDVDTNGNRLQFIYKH